MDFRGDSPTCCTNILRFPPTSPVSSSGTLSLFFTSITSHPFCILSRCRQARLLQKINPSLTGYCKVLFKGNRHFCQSDKTKSQCPGLKKHEIYHTLPPSASIFILGAHRLGQCCLRVQFAFNDVFISHHPVASSRAKCEVTANSATMPIQSR